MIWIANKTCFYKSLATFSWRHGGAHIPLHCRILLRKAAHLVWSVKYSHRAKYGERGNIFILQDKLWRHGLSWVDGMMTSPCCEAAVTAGWVVLRKSETLNQSMSKRSQNALAILFLRPIINLRGQVTNWILQERQGGRSWQAFGKCKVCL